MTKTSERLTSREFVWVHRMRQRIAFEQIIVKVGKPSERQRAKQFLEAIEEANPELLDDMEQYTLDLYVNDRQFTPELFEDNEYSKTTGLKTAFELPKDIRWEKRVVQRAAKEYRDLFHPCEKKFDNAMKGLQYVHNLHPKLFSKAKIQAIEQRDQILNFEIYCQCGCTNPENSHPADSFTVTNLGRLESVSKRISFAKQSQEETCDKNQGHWQFFLDRIMEVAPEMMQV